MRTICVPFELARALGLLLVELLTGMNESFTRPGDRHGVVIRDPTAPGSGNPASKAPATSQPERKDRPGCSWSSRPVIGKSGQFARFQARTIEGMTHPNMPLSPGRAPSPAGIRVAAARQAHAAIDALARIAGDQTTDAAARVEATKTILSCAVQASGDSMRLKRHRDIELMRGMRDAA